MTNLDDLRLYRLHDATNLRRRIRELPDQCWAAWEQGPSPVLPMEYRKVKRIVVAGMGGSAIGGDLLKSLMAREDGPPVEVLRDFTIGEPLDRRTLVIISSYSGDTDETISAYAEARRSPAHRVVVTSGGKLADMAEQDYIPIYNIKYRGEPRSALGYSFLTLLSCVNRLGLIRDKTRDVEDAVNLLRQMADELNEEVPEETNPAKELAQRAYGSLIGIYGGDIFSPVARRWKTQFNENSKVWAFFETLPEATHNAVEGYNLPDAVRNQTMIFVLHSDSLSEPLKARYAAVEDLLREARVSYQKVEALGNAPLSQMLSLVLLGDYISYYLAILNEVDPSPVPSIDLVKSRAQKR